MEDIQMEYVIKKIRENEEKTQELTTVLEGFHQSFDRLIGNIERVVETGTIEQATKSVRQLDTHLGRIEKQIYTHHEEGKAVLEQVARHMDNVGGPIGSGDSKVQTDAKRLQNSDKAIIENDRIYVISPDKKTIYAYNLKDGSRDVYHTHDCVILTLGTCGGEVYIYDEERKIYETSRLLEPILEDVASYWFSHYGIVYKNPMGNIKLYKFDGNQKSLAKRVGDFEVVDGRYVLFQSVKEGLQLIDLKTMNVDQPLHIK